MIDWERAGDLYICIHTIQSFKWIDVYYIYIDIHRMDEWTFFLIFLGVSKMKVSRSISSTFQAASSKFKNLSILSCYWQRHWSRSSFFRDGIKRSRCISLNREWNFAPPCFPANMMEGQRLSKGFKFSKDLSFCYWVLSLVAWSHIPTAVRIDFYVAARGRKRKRFQV